MSRYSTSATKVGSTQVALGFLIGLVSFDLGLTTVSGCFVFLFGGGQYYTDSSTDLHLSCPIAELEIFPISPAPQRWVFRFHVRFAAHLGLN
jgi:hypothetical protein